MSTTPTPEPQAPDPQTMPLPELRAALYSPPTPPAAEPQPAAAPEPAAPPTPEPYSVTPNQDGTWHIKLDTGEEFNGKAEDILPKLAKSKYDSSAYAKQLKAQLDAAQPQPAPTDPPAPAAPALRPDQLEVSSYMIDLVKTNPALAQEMLAAVTGIPVDAVGATFGQMAQVVRDVQASSTAAEFHRVCPDFSDSPQDVEKLLGVMSELGLPQTVQGLELGHSYCLRKGVYQPLTQTQQQAATPGRKLPAPIPDGSASQPTGEPNAWTMPKDQLKALLERGQ